MYIASGGEGSKHAERGKGVLIQLYLADKIMALLYFSGFTSNSNSCIGNDRNCLIYTRSVVNGYFGRTW